MPAFKKNGNSMRRLVPAIDGAMNNACVLAYDTDTYNFAEYISKNIFKVDSLKQLHKWYKNDSGFSTNNERISYQDNMFLRKILAGMPRDSRFYNIYHKFQINVVAPFFAGSITYGNKPTFRVHMAGSPSISKPHRDIEVTKRDEQITVWVPLVDTFESNTLYVQANYDSGDYFPVSLKYGEALLFDGGWLKHGSFHNQTNVTRISFDFRMSPGPVALKKLKNPDLDILSLRPKKSFMPTLT